MNDTLFRLLALLLLLIGGTISGYHRRKADRQGQEKISLQEEGRLMVIALRLAGLLSWGAIFTWLINPAWMAWAHLDLPEWMRWLGVALGAGADVLALWVFTHLGSNVTPTVVARPQAYLVTSGPYRYVRHPLYVMGIIGYTGFALLAENWFIALMTVAGFSLIVLRTANEEAHLLEKFGDEYRRYMQTTGRFLPKWTK